MGGITSEKQPAKPHRLGNEAAQWRNALFDRGAGDEAIASLFVQAGLKLLPETFIGPGFDVLRKTALQIIAAARRRSHRAERETERVSHIDQFFRDRRRIGQN